MNSEVWDITLEGDYTGPSDGDDQDLDYLGVSTEGFISGDYTGP